ncbi:MAG: hypothetical protein ACRCYS_18490, partial [Beijerinckiaceae bacterium]
MEWRQHNALTPFPFSVRRGMRHRQLRIDTVWNSYKLLFYNVFYLTPAPSDGNDGVAPTAALLDGALN